MNGPVARSAWIHDRKKMVPSVIVVVMLVLVSAVAMIVSSGRANPELTIASVSASPAEVYVGQYVEWTVVVDLQYNGQLGNGLLFTWDWEDGTYSVDHLASVNDSDTAVDVQTHAWAEPGLYEVMVSVWDGYGSDENPYRNVSATMPFIVNEGITTRSVDYRWHDMFAHPLGPWYEDRLMNYGNEYAVTDSYPYLYVKEDAPPGNTQVNTFMQLTVDASDVSEVNMNENPEFLPFFGDARGGNAELDWHMDYITREESEAKLSGGANAWYDGWFIAWNGSVILDEQAAKGVLGVTEPQLEDFDTWWAINSDGVKMEWKSWLNHEASNDRLAIYSMYEYDLTLLYFVMDAEMVGDEVLITFDTVSWGMEALMTRWLHEAFMPTEWYMEDMHLNATIGPGDSEVRLSAAVGYALTASETIEDGAPCWAWQAMLQDSVESSPEYPISDFDPYADLEYFITYPGNEWYHTMMPYDYTPGAWNLSEGEALSFEWPAGEVLFLVDDPTGVGSGMVDGALDFWSPMTVNHSEPMPADAPGNVAIDMDARQMTFTGPFDMWTWSRDQVAHSYLSDEWDRLGILPYGMPYIEFRAIGQPNTPPTASFTIAPETGTVDTVFSFDASSSFDREDPAENLTVKWDWESDGIWDTTSAVDKTAEHQYSIDDTHTVTLEVVDSGGLVGYASKSILVLESPILTPHDPIYICGDDDFTAENGVVGGSGTYSDPYVIKRWSINASQADAIRIEGTTSFFIVRNVEVFDGELLLDGFEANDGVALSDVSNGRVEYVTAWNCRYGVSVFDSDNVAIANNVVYFNNFSGLCLHNCDSVTVYGNCAQNNTANGIIVGYSSNCSVAGNWVEDTGWNGYAHYSIEIWNSESCEAVGNWVISGGTGIGLSATNDCTIADNRITKHSGRAIYLDSSDYSDVTGNEVASISTSIYAFNCRFTTIADNELTSLAGDFWSGDIKCEFCFDTVVDGNSVVSESSAGIDMRYSTDSIVIQNEVTTNGSGIQFDYCTSSVAVDNIVVSEASYGVILMYCADSVVEGNEVTSLVNMGITFYRCDNLSVTANVAVSNAYGIYLRTCTNSLVEGNQATSYRETGIYIANSTDTEVTDNIASSDGDKWWTGCMILSLLTDAVVTCNTVIGGLHGILVSDSTGVILYHNDFINNTVHAYDNRGAENSWDNGYPDGGNYWSSYDGIDERSGVNQDELGSDGIGDTPFIIDSNSTDRYPLVEGPAPVTEPSLVYRIYDMFEEPWGDWWEKRPYGGWDTNRLLTADAGNVTSLYSVWGKPKLSTEDQGMIYAPYRWNVTGTDLPNIDVHSPTMMPKMGSDVTGAEASMDIYFQYGYQEWWDDYWVPEWSTHPDWGDWEALLSTFDDGWYVYTVYDIDMNHEAAEEWLGMGASDDPDDWWATNEDTYVDAWDTWIVTQGNFDFDIFCGYDYAYVKLSTTMMRLTGDLSDVHMEIAHVSWGYEALMTRWLSATGLSVHQPCFEDFEMVVDFRETNIDIEMDAICQWSMHCVKQDAATPGDAVPCAWVWEPIGLDYIYGGDSHPSAYDPYDPVMGNVTYHSWNCGDPNYDTEIGYEYTPMAFDLPSYASLVLELPLGSDILGYYAEPVPEDALKDVWLGDYSVYDSLRYTGEMTPGFMELGGCSDWSYDAVSKVLTINGPWDFTNPHPDDPSLLYHGAPWIEFNVIPTTSIESIGAEGSSAVLELCPAAASVGGELASFVGTMCAVMLTTVAMAAGVGRRREC